MGTGQSSISEQAPIRFVDDETPEEREDILDDMVRQVLPDQDGNSEFNLDALKVEHDFIDVGKDVKDETRPLKDIMTKLVVEKFFESEDTLYRFLNLVYREFDDLLAKYREARGLTYYQAFFIYKGGNILRIIANEFLLELPKSAVREISEFYAPFFKRGDADFSIYVDPEVEPYNDIYYEVSLLAYLMQVRLRNKISANLDDYFNFFRYNPDYQARLLEPYLNELNEVEAFRDMFDGLRVGDAQVGNAPTYMPNNDATLRFVNLREDWLTDPRQAAIGVILPAERNPTIMSITHNNTLDFYGMTTDTRIRFALTRTKIIFTAHQYDGRTKNIGGELIDVSVPHSVEFSMESFYKNVANYTTQYKLKYKEQQLSFTAYSIDYLARDLEKILFEQFRMPWDDRKYAKRVNRLFYLNFVDLFIVLEDGTAKLNILRVLRDQVLMPMSKATDLMALQAAIVAFERQNSILEKLLLGRLASNLENLVGRIDQQEDREALREMGSVLVQNATILIESISEIRTYCTYDGRVQASQIRSAQVENFV